MKVLGIDESGRGPVCGPLVLCGYLIDEAKVKKLKTLGVKDSKLLSPEQRTQIASSLKKLADDYVLLKVSAKEIDKLRDKTNINLLEIEKMQQIINALNPEKVVIDSPETNTVRFTEKIRGKLKNKRVKIISENYADKNHLEVSAASILAKQLRDAEVKKLHKKHGFFGSGYPSDEVTVKFLRAWIKKNKEFPDFVRKSWYTAQKMMEEKQQTNLRGFK